MDAIVKKNMRANSPVTHTVAGYEVKIIKKHHDALLLSSKDGYLQCIDLVHRENKWSYQTHGIVEGEIFVTEDKKVVCTSLSINGLFTHIISLKDGRQIAQIAHEDANLHSKLEVIGQRIFVQSSLGTLTEWNSEGIQVRSIVSCPSAHLFSNGKALATYYDHFLYLYQVGREGLIAPESPVDMHLYFPEELPTITNICFDESGVLCRLSGQLNEESKPSHLSFCKVDQSGRVIKACYLPSNLFVSKSGNSFFGANERFVFYGQKDQILAISKSDQKCTVLKPDPGFSLSHVCLSREGVILADSDRLSSWYSTIRLCDSKIFLWDSRSLEQLGTITTQFGTSLQYYEKGTVVLLKSDSIVFKNYLHLQNESQPKSSDPWAFSEMIRYVTLAVSRIFIRWQV